MLLDQFQHTLTIYTSDKMHKEKTVNISRLGGKTEITMLNHLFPCQNKCNRKGCHDLVQYWDYT